MSVLQKFTRYDDPNSLASRIRAKRTQRLKEMIAETFDQQGGVRIADLGGETQYWLSIGLPFLVMKNVTVFLINRYEHNIPHNPAPEVFTVQIGDCCEMTEYRDWSYDLAHSNSVIEHVGNFRRMQQFAYHGTRIARRYYHQTPAFEFPIEPHFGAVGFHWLPEPARVWLTRHRQMGNFPKATSRESAHDFVQDVHLLTRGNFTRLFPEADIVEEKILGLTKSYTATL